MLSCPAKRRDTIQQSSCRFSIAVTMVLLLFTLNLYKYVLTCYGKDLTLACHLGIQVTLSSIQFNTSDCAHSW